MEVVGVERGVGSGAGDASVSAQTGCGGSGIASGLLGDGQGGSGRRGFELDLARQWRAAAARVSARGGGIGCGATNRLREIWEHGARLL